MTAPTVTVEIAFTSTFSTASADMTWTDVTAYVDVDQAVVATTGGRTDERTTADANSLTLTFDNRDGRFTPEKTTGAYYPNVKLYRPIRIWVAYPGASASIRFFGYIRSWTPGWSGGSDAMAQVTVQAASRMQRLGITDALRSVVEEEILVDKPVAYYTCGEPAGATAAYDSSGTGSAPLVASAGVTFGTATGPSTDGLTAASFINSGVLTVNRSGDTMTALTIECFVVLPTTPPSVLTLLNLFHNDTIAVTSTGALGGSGTTATSPVLDGRLHHLALTHTSGGATTLYVDGVATVTGTSTIDNTIVKCAVGSGGNDPAYAPSISHVAWYATALSASRIAAHAAAGLTGFAGESTYARAARYASWRGISIDAGREDLFTIGTTRSIQHFDPTGMTVIEALRVLEQTEGGVLYDAPTYATILRGEASRYTAGTRFTLDLAQQYVTAEFVPQYDDAQLLNDVTVTNVGDQSTGRYVNQASVNSYGRAGATPQTASTYADAPTDDATWLVGRYAEPSTRLQSVTIAVHALTEAEATLRALIWTVDVGHCIAISNLPAQFAASTGSFFVEGWSERFGVGTHYLTLNLSSAAAYLGAFILDDATRGVLDSAYYLGH